MNNYATAERSKREIAAGENVQTRMKECTFRPRVGRTGERRQFGRFLADQRKFNEKIRTDIDRLATEARQKEMALFQDQPKISARSRQLAQRQESRAGSAIYERLYSTRRPETERKGTTSAEKRRRGSPARIQRLYEDAKSREQSRERGRELQSAHKPNCNKREVTGPFLAARFDKEFKACVESLGFPSEDNVWLDLNQMSKSAHNRVAAVMSMMDFTQDCADSDQYTALTFQIFTLLDQRKLGKISSLNLRTFAAAILDIPVDVPAGRIAIPPEDEQVAAAPSQTAAPYGSFNEDGVLVMSTEETARTHAAFQLLCHTRNAYHCDRAKLRRTRTAVEPLSLPKQKELSRRLESFVDLAVQSQILKSEYA